MNGILAVDKPYGWTSHDVVARVRVLTRQRRIGHAGTLDPMATGVLLLCLGEATRVSEALMEGTKWYLARVAFGISTTTDDALGTVLASGNPSFTRDELVSALRQSIGAIEQRPPAFAAIKRCGVPAYKAARRGQALELPARSVVVHSISLLSVSTSDGRDRGADDDRVAALAKFPPAPSPATDGRPVSAHATLLVSCGKGTYIRALARDLGDALRCGAHLAALRRLASGSFSTRETVALADVEKAEHARGPEGIACLLAPIDRALDEWPAIVVSAGQASQVANGAGFSLRCPFSGPRARLYDARGTLLALARLEASRQGFKTVKPFRVFARAGS